MPIKMGSKPETLPLTAKRSAETQLRHPSRIAARKCRIGPASWERAGRHQAYPTPKTPHSSENQAQQHSSKAGEQARAQLRRQIQTQSTAQLRALLLAEKLRTYATCETYSRQYKTPDHTQQVRPASCVQCHNEPKASSWTIPRRRKQSEASKRHPVQPQKPHTHEGRHGRNSDWTRPNFEVNPPGSTATALTPLAAAKTLPGQHKKRAPSWQGVPDRDLLPENHRQQQDAYTAHNPKAKRS